MRTAKYHTIGAKLLLVFACNTALLTIVSLVAWSTWNGLDLQVSKLLGKSIPKYNASYLLESRSSNIRHSVQLLESVDSKVKLDEHVQILQDQFYKIQQTLDNIDSTANGQRLITAYHDLQITLSHYSVLVSNRIDQRRSINLLQEQMKWVHQDIQSELTPLRQEFHWQIERQQSSKSMGYLLSQLDTIQRILDIENAIYTFAEDMINTKQASQVDNGMKVIQYRAEELLETSVPIFSHPSSIAYQQLLNELITLIKPEGEFHQQLLNMVSLNQQVRASQHTIERQLNQVHLQIASLVSNAGALFIEVKRDTANTVDYGNNILMLCFSLSILISLLLTYYFINRRIVSRLTRLSESLDAIINHELSHPIHVDGNDEIGRLSKKLVEYGDKVQEMERTNALSLINNTLASLITCNLAGQVESANLSARKLLRLENQINEKPLWQCFPASGRRQIQALFSLDSPLMTQHKADITLALSAPFKPCYLRCSFRLFIHGHNEKIIITMTDITEQEQTNRLLESRVEEKTRDLTKQNHRLVQEIEERERAEQHLTETQNELIQAAKMAVVGQTMTSLAHELNQPLNAMSTYLYSTKIMIEQGEKEQVSHSIQQIEGLTARMSKIINSLRHFARKSDSEETNQRVKLHEVVEHAITLVNTRAKRQQIAIHNVLSTNTTVLGRALAIEQVMINLMVNSCDAMSETHLSQKEISVEHLFSTQTHHVIAVSDTGSGFSPSIINKIFTPFTTTKEVGLGLGMNICQSLIEQNQGSIYLASTIRHGAMIILELPYEQQ